MPLIVGVQFKEVGKVYYFSPENIEFLKGDGVIVETARGVEYGKVVMPNREAEEKEIVGTLKPVIRKATEKDEESYAVNVSKRVKAIKDAQEKIDKRKLEMKIVDAEFTFDNSKVVFYFTADGRVDFRDLVKELAGIFKLRIELRQIGIRDECKIKGGLGPCGRACCCNSYLGDFERVSIKMAKNQGLSLNPAKISGLCGRLMCCLKFEDDYYAETLKLMPKQNSEIDTPDGKGLVEDTDLLKRRVKVRLRRPNGETELKDYSLDELKIEVSAAEETADDVSESDDELLDIPEEI